MTEKIRKTDAEWHKLLTPEQYFVARMSGTERPFTGAYHDCKKPGVYEQVILWFPVKAAAPATGLGRRQVRPMTDGATPVWHAFPVRVAGGRRDACVAFLEERGIGTNIH